MDKVGLTDIAEVVVLPKNITHVSILKGAEINVSSAKRLLDTIELLSNKEIPYRGGMIDISNANYIDQQARDLLIAGSGLNGRLIGMAFISTSFLSKTMGNMFLGLGNATRFPAKYFDSPIRAEHWLRTLMRKAMENDDFQRRVA